MDQHRKIPFYLFALIAIFTVFSTASGQVIDPVQRAAVGIRVTKSDNAEQGVGFIISADSDAIYVLTARHLFFPGQENFKGNTQITFAPDPRNEYPGTLQFDSSNLDVAVVKVLTRTLPTGLGRAITNLPAVKVRPINEPLRVREDVFLLGGSVQDWQVPKDSVSGLQDGPDRLDRFRFTGTGVHSGFSGSAILDKSDRLLGVHLGGVESDENYGRAQRISDAISVLSVNHIPMNKLDLDNSPANTNTTDGTTSVSTSSCLPPPPGLVAWWPGDGTADDIIGGNNPSAMNAVGFAMGKVGEGLIFGQGGYIAIPASPRLANQRFTWSAWVRPDGSAPMDDSGMAILGQVALGPAHSVPVQLLWRPKDFKFHFYCGNYQVDHILSTDAFPPGAFYLVTGEYDGSVFRLFVNGQLQGAYGAIKTVDYSPSIPWAIGQGGLMAINTHPRTWNGVIDEVQAFNRALSPAEIQSIFRAGSAGQCKPRQASR